MCFWETLQKSRMFDEAQAIGLVLIIGSIILFSGCSKQEGGILPNQNDTEGKTWYVSPQGDDANAGTSRDSAFRTLKRALNAVQPGDTVIILAGIYNDSIVTEDFGSVDAGITVRGESQQNQPVFDGQNRKKILWRCFRCKGITLENIEVRNYRATAVGFFTGENITVRNVTFRNVARETGDWVSGGSSALALIEVTNFKVERVQVFDSGFRDIQSADAGMLVNCWNCQDGTISSSVVRNYEGVGILIEDSQNVIVENSTVQNGQNDMGDWWTSGYWLDGGLNCVLRQNTADNNTGPGIQVSDSEVQYPQGFSKNFVIEKNTLRRNTIGIYIWNYGQCPAPEDAVTLRNNVFEGNDQDIKCLEWACGVGQPCVTEKSL